MPLSKIGESFAHSTDVVVRIEVEDGDTGILLSEEVWATSGSVEDVEDAIVEAAENLTDLVTHEFEN